MSDNPLKRLMNPKSITTVGAGNNPMKMGTMHALSVLNSGFSGKFLPVHPRETKVLGHDAFPSVKELPEAPDLAIIIVPTDQVKGILEDLGKLGTRSAVVITAGFKEVGEHGLALEEELNEISAKYGIRFLGPNCIGIINTEISLNTTVISMDNSPGKLGLLSQSGTYVAQTQPYLLKRGIHYSKAISLGNEANINIVEALDYLGEDEQTKAIALYIEGIRNGKEFIETARRISAKKPIVAQYVGGTEAGARSGQSHTGAMAGPDFLFSGLFRQCGIISVNTVEELYSHAWALATQPLMRGNRIGILTNSGGPGTAIADTADREGLTVPRFSEKLRDQIKGLIPAHSPRGNPVDLTFHMDIKVLTETIPELIMKSGEVDGLILHGAMQSGFLKAIYPNLKSIIGNFPLEDLLAQLDQDKSGAMALHKKHGIPLLVSAFFDRDDNYTETYQDCDISVFDSPEKAARTMASLYRYSLARKRKEKKEASIPPVSDEAVKIIEEAKQKGQHSLDEYQAKKILAAYGIPVSNEAIAESAEEAIQAAEKIGFPVVLKVCSPEILHKTESGLIHLNIKTTDDVAAAFAAISKSAGQVMPVLVQEMVAGDRELFAGMIRFPAFGPCILFGLGGIFAEIFNDSTIRIAPFSRETGLDMISCIKSQAMLENFRGLPGADLDRIADILVALGALSIHHHEISEIDINPLIIQGSMPVAVDALIVLDRT